MGTKIRRRSIVLALLAVSLLTLPGASPSAGTLAPGTAHVVMTGENAFSSTMRQGVGPEYPTGDGSFVLWFQDDDENLFQVSLHLEAGQLTDASVALFAGVWVPVENCEIALDQLDEDAVRGTATCDDLEAQFYAVPAAQLPSPPPTPTPAPWYPEGYTLWSSDLAWQWLDRSELDCSVDSCWGMFVMTRYGCPTSLWVELQITDPSGTVVDSLVDSVGTLERGQQARLSFSSIEEGPLQAEPVEMACL
jgi:hypothetical protein